MPEPPKAWEQACEVLTVICAAAAIFFAFLGCVSWTNGGLPSTPQNQSQGVP